MSPTMPVRGLPRGARALFMLALAITGCVVQVDGVSDGASEVDCVDAVGVVTAPIMTSSLLSANGTYGAGCSGGRANTSWSVQLSIGAALDNAALAVVRGDSGCVLSLRSVRTGTGANNLWTAQTPIALSASYPASGTLFTSPTASFAGNAKLSAVTFDDTFTLTVAASADPMVNTGSSSAQYTYEGYILAKETPLSYWRLNESVLATDAFTGATDAMLQSPRGSITWTKTNGSTANAVLSDQGRVRGTTAAKTVYLSSVTPSSAEYAVAADVYVRSILTEDQAGVVIRGVNTDTFYYAGYVASATVDLGCFCATRQWQLWKYAGGVGVLGGTYTMTLTQGNTYRLFLEVRGSIVSVFIDGVQRISANDALLPNLSVGNPGILLGALGSTPQTNNAGLHLDNFSVQALTAADSKGSNTGTYVDYVTLGASGATNSPGNTAVSWVGSGYVDATRTISDDFSIEFWYRATQGTGAGSAWYTGAGLVDATSSTSNPSGFGVSVRADGKVLAGTANSYVCGLMVCTDQGLITSTGMPSLNAWHHVVFTRTRSSGALALYIDGMPAGTATGPTVALTGATKLNIGRIQTGVNYFTGSIDEVTIYNTVLNADAVSAHYARK